MYHDMAIYRLASGVGAGNDYLGDDTARTYPVWIDLSYVLALASLASINFPCLGGE